MGLDLEKKEKKKPIFSAIDLLEKRINKFTRKWYLLFLIDVVIIVVIGVLTWLGYDVNAEIQKIVGTLGLTGVVGIFEVRVLYNKIQERKKWSVVPKQLKDIPDTLRGLLLIANTDPRIDFVRDLYIKMNQVILLLHIDDKEKAVAVLNQVISSLS